MTRFDVGQFRRQFPILSRKVNGKPLIYFDNAATNQKPFSVIQSVSHYHQHSNANVHRAAHALSSEATKLFEDSRDRVRAFLNAQSVQEIIWTKGTTEAINLVAQAWGQSNLTQGDEIVLSYAEHHANIVPWQIVAEQTGAIIRVLPLNEAGTIDLNSLDEYISNKAKIIAVSHVSNVIGKVNPIEEIIAKGKSVGALTLIDGAQAVAHFNVDVQLLDCDFYVFSGHKMYAPMGIGVLYGKQKYLNAMPPYQTGGEMIKKVSFEGTSFNQLPFKFEAGTPNVAGVLGLGKAIEFLQEQQHGAADNRNCYEHELLDYCYQQLSSIEQLSFVAKGRPDVGNFSFVIDNVHHQDIAVYLDAHGVAVRSGHHCAMPLMDYLGLPGCIRWSLAAYNTKDEVDFAISCLRNFLSNDGVSDNYQSPSDDAELILERFKRAKSWDSKHREIMLAGKDLLRLSPEFKSQESLISGCESAAWLTYSQDAEGRFAFQADSEAKVIRGLLFIVLSKYQGLKASEIMAVDIDGYFEQLGLLQHLSPSRGNGLKAIVARIIKIAQQSLS